MIVITGATGNVGRPLVGLLSQGGERVVALSRSAQHPPVEGVEHRSADLFQPSTLTVALAGADAVFLVAPGPIPAVEVVAAIQASGARHVVLLSSIGAMTRPDAYRHFVALEDAVRASGLTWTILQPTGFASNALSWSEPIRSNRRAPAPFADVALPVVDPYDIAEVAAAVLRSPEEHAGKTYVLTGPELVSPRQRAAIIAEALGEPVDFVEQSRDEAREQMLGLGVPEIVVDGTLGVLGEPLDAEREVSGAVQEVLGRRPRSFADWAADHAAAFK